MPNWSPFPVVLSKKKKKESIYLHEIINWLRNPTERGNLSFDRIEE